MMAAGKVWGNGILDTPFCLFVCLFVAVNPKNAYFASSHGFEVILFFSCFAATQIARQVH